MTEQPIKIAWVTGASQGIGKALTKELCAKGISVYASARGEAGLDSLAAELEGLPGKVIPCPLDVTDLEAVQGYFQQWQQAQAEPELIILNAGTHDPFPAQEFTAARVEALMQVNINGTLRSLQPALDLCLRRGSGQIAIMASVAGYRGLPTAAAYGASKAALINLAEALKLDLEGTGVDLRLICPGFVRTPLTDKNDFAMPALVEPEQAAKWIIKGLGSSRFEIAFPRRFVLVLKCLRWLPYGWYFPLVGKMTS